MSAWPKEVDASDVAICALCVHICNLPGSIERRRLMLHLLTLLTGPRRTPINLHDYIARETGT